MKTEDGKRFFDREAGPVWKESDTEEADEVLGEVPRGWNVIVVKRGQLVNFVSPKTSNPKKEE